MRYETRDHTTQALAGRLEGRVALITGGTSGIGKATALLFARAGARVALTGRRVEKGEQVVTEIKKIGGQGMFIPADHTHSEDCFNAVEEVIRNYSRLDILFNNAGIVISGTAETTTEQDWSYTLELNVSAVWRMSRLAIPVMRIQGGGVIVNNASDWGVVGARDAVAYCTSKGAVIQLTRAMALDHAHENIRINAICPGDTFVDRWLDEVYFEGSDGVDMEHALKESGVGLPLGRVAMPEEIAKTVLFLASDDSSYMTGSILMVDGGNTAR